MIKITIVANTPMNAMAMKKFFKLKIEPFSSIFSSLICILFSNNKFRLDLVDVVGWLVDVLEKVVVGKAVVVVKNPSTSYSKSSTVSRQDLTLLS